MSNDKNPEGYQKIEDGIGAVWGVKDVIDTLVWRYVDHPKPMTEDEVWNHLYSISCLIDLHCEKLMDTYCQVFKLNQYASDEVKEHRAQILNQLVNPPKVKKVKKK